MATDGISEFHPYHFLENAKSMKKKILCRDDEISYIFSLLGQVSEVMLPFTQSQPIFFPQIYEYVIVIHDFIFRHQKMNLHLPFSFKETLPLGNR